MHNPFKTPFKQSRDSARAPEKVKSNIDMGFSLTPLVKKNTRLHFEVNYKDVTSQHNIKSSFRLQTAMELDVARKFFLRFGYGGNGVSGGLGQQKKGWKWNFALHSTDVEDSGIQEKRDIKIAFSNHFIL